MKWARVRDASSYGESFRGYKHFNRCFTPLPGSSYYSNRKHSRNHNDNISVWFSFCCKHAQTHKRQERGGLRARGKSYTVKRGLPPLPLHLSFITEEPHVKQKCLVTPEPQNTACFLHSKPQSHLERQWTICPLCLTHGSELEFAIKVETLVLFLCQCI